MTPMEETKNGIQRELEAIYGMANQVYEWYLEEYEMEYRGDVKTEDKPRYYLSVKKKEISVEMYWMLIDFGKDGTEWKRRNIHVKLGKQKNRYEMSQFKKAPGWQKEAIDQVEEKLKTLRMRSKGLVKMMRMVAGYEQNIENYCGDLEQWIEEQDKN